MRNSYIVLIVLLNFALNIKAQQVSDKKILKKIRGKDIEWITGSSNLAKVKMKSTKKWGVYNIDAYYDLGEEVITFNEVVAPKFDSIGWFKDMEPFTIVKIQKKYGILLNPYEIHDATESVRCVYDAVKLKEVDGRYYALIKDNGKWGLVDWFEDVILVDPTFENPDNVPLIQIEGWAKDIFLASKKALKADILIFDDGNGDGVFKARNKAIKKWGMYQSLSENDIKTLIPAKYDSISNFGFNANYTAVYNKGKVGIYLSYWSYHDKAKQSVPCEYEDYKKYDVDGVPKLAVKKNEKWGWVNWLTGEEKYTFKYETTDDLPYPYYKQAIWFED